VELYTIPMNIRFTALMGFICSIPQLLSFVVNVLNYPISIFWGLNMIVFLVVSISATYYKARQSSSFRSLLIAPTILVFSIIFFVLISSIVLLATVGIDAVAINLPMAFSEIIINLFLVVPILILSIITALIFRKRKQLLPTDILDADLKETKEPH